MHVFLLLLINNNYIAKRPYFNADVAPIFLMHVDVWTGIASNVNSNYSPIIGESANKILYDQCITIKNGKFESIVNCPMTIDSNDSSITTGMPSNRPLILPSFVNVDFNLNDNPLVNIDNINYDLTDTFDTNDLNLFEFMKENAETSLNIISNGAKNLPFYKTAIYDLTQPSVNNSESRNNNDENNYQIERDDAMFMKRVTSMNIGKQRHAATP